MSTVGGRARHEELNQDSPTVITLRNDQVDSTTERLIDLSGPEVTDTDVAIPLRMATSALAVGELGEAQSWTSLGLERVATSHANPLDVCRLHTMMSALLMEWNDIQRSLAHATTALQQLESARTSEDHVIASLQAATAYAAAGMYELALAQLDSARQSALTGMPNPNVQDLLVREHVAVLLDIGDANDAGQWVEGFERRSIIPGDNPDVEALQLRLAAALGKTDGLGDEAIRLLKSLRSDASLRTRIEVGTASAVALEAAGRHSEALVILSTAVQLGETEGFIHAIARHSPRITPLLQQLRNSGPQARHVWSPAYLDRIITATVSPELRPETGLGVETKGSYEPLSDRELQVLRLLNGTLSNREIGAELYLSVNTVKTHVKSVYAKLGVNRRAEAVSRARTLGLAQEHD